MGRFPSAAKSRHERSNPLCNRLARGRHRRDDSGLGRCIPASRCGARFGSAKRNPCCRWAVSIYEKPDLFWIAIGGFWIWSLVQPYGLDCADDSCDCFLLSPYITGGKELSRKQGERFLAYRRAAPRLVPSIRPCLPASGATPHWPESLRGQTPWWGVAAAEIAYAYSFRLGFAIMVALVGFVIFIVQKYVMKSFSRPATGV